MPESGSHTSACLKTEGPTTSPCTGGSMVCRYTPCGPPKMRCVILNNTIHNMHVCTSHDVQLGVSKRLLLKHQWTHQTKQSVWQKHHSAHTSQFTTTVQQQHTQFRLAANRSGVCSQDNYSSTKPCRTDSSFGSISISKSSNSAGVRSSPGSTSAR